MVEGKEIGSKKKQAEAEGKDDVQADQPAKAGAESR
jgi:hypothetical protein